MREKRLFVLMMFILFFVLGALAKPVTQDGAKKVAERFVSLYAANTDLSVDEVLNYELINGRTGYYLVKLLPVGWVMVSGDDVLKPVIAYSFDRKFLPIEEWEESAKKWIEKLEDHIVQSLKDEELRKNNEWDEIFKESYVKSVAGTTVEPLIEVEWDQGSGWNRFCPEDPDGPGGHAYVGCVAVAMAQAMSVHQYPEYPRGEHGYTSENYGYIYVDYDSQEPYNWGVMSNTYSDDENARLLYHLAVAVNMDFAADGSGAYTSLTASLLKQYFSYAPTAVYKSRSGYTDEAWRSLIIDELVEGRPVIYAGDGDDGDAGHSFNVDGVGADGSYFHLNWGWSGNGNGYYTLDHLVPAYSSGTPILGNYSFNSGAVFGLRPPISGPYGISLSNNSVYDKQEPGYFVGMVEVADENDENVYSYSLKGPFNPITREYDPPSFFIVNDSLKTSETFNYDQSRQEHVFIEVVDTAGNSYSENFIIDIEKYYFGPTDMVLSKNIVEEGKDPGFFVGMLHVEDDITINNYAYSCNGGYNSTDLSEDDSFIVRHDSLFTNRTFYMSDGLNYFLSLSLSDQHGHFLTKLFELNIVENISGGTEIDEHHSIGSRIYPNPASGYLTLEYTGSSPGADAVLNIYNTLGEHMGSSIVRSGDRIDISGLENGIYFISVYSDQLIMKRKLVIH